MYTDKQKIAICTQLDRISERHLYNWFESNFDEIHGKVEIGGYSYMSSHALKEVDPIAYEEEFKNWLDEEIGNMVSEEMNGDYYSQDEVDELLESLEEEEIA